MNGHLHWVLAALGVWLVATSPWLSMFRRFPDNGGFFDHAHVVLGWLVLFLAVIYCVTVSPGGRWRWFFPWATGQMATIGRDAAGITRGRVPAADGPGLYGAIKGLLLLAMLATAITGAGWSLVQGTDLALGLRDMHQGAVKVLLVAGAAHVLAVASHLVDLMRS